jgi:predicted alpha/beta hydrolase family esterase
MPGKKDNTPVILKFVRWMFPKLEKVAPAIAHRYFLKVFFTPLHFKPTDKELQAERFAKKFSFNAAGQKLQGYEWGDERWPYILVVHGWAGRATQFRRFIKPMMNSGIRVVGFDGPAHGRSTGTRTELAEFEKCIREIYTLKGEPAGVLAHSFGGVAILYAAANGLAVKKLVNIASPSIGDEVIKTFLKAVNGSWSTGEFFKSHIQKRYGKSFDEFSSLHLVRNLPNPFPILLVHDENDREVEIKHSNALMKVYPQANLIRTKKLGHTRILKDDEVIRRCVTFMRDGASLPK